MTDHDVRSRLMRKIDHMDLQSDERALMWAILTAAKDRVHVIEVPQAPDTFFENEFATAFTEGPAEAIGSSSTHIAVGVPPMIVR